MRTLYWFRRDLRLEDNKAFEEAVNSSTEIIPVFVFSEKILSNFNVKDDKLGFIVEAIQNLSREIEQKGGKLYCFKGEEETIFNKLIISVKPDRIVTTASVSWTGKEMETIVESLSKKRNIPFLTLKEGFLQRIPIKYTKIFTPFFKKWKKSLDLTTSPSPRKINTPALPFMTIEELKNSLPYSRNNYFNLQTLYKTLNTFDFARYGYTRDLLYLEGTSKLSPFIRFGIISLRGLYRLVSSLVGEESPFLKELCWREFWYHIKEHFNDFRTLEFQEKRRNIKWWNQDQHIEAFMEGKTGYPVVDAAIAQLKEEHWMHGRARMIVASFLTKDLLVDWRIGEAFFARHLLDYDEVVNVGNWQWSASVGPDPRPLRIFNPLIQSRKFDPEGIFIKKYLPQLKDVPSHLLHDPLRNKLPYHKPIVNHYEMSKRAFKLYKDHQTD